MKADDSLFQRRTSAFFFEDARADGCSLEWPQWPLFSKVEKWPFAITSL
jgi:hypothetical protein